MKKESFADMALRATSLFGMLTLAVISGAFVMFFDVPPANTFRSAFVGMAAYLDKSQYKGGEKLNPYMWKEARRSQSGVLRHEPGKAFDGYTLLTNAAFSGAWLVDMDGKLVYKWMVTYRQAFPDSPHVRDPMKEDWIFWRRAIVYPNGDVLAIFEAFGDTPYGYGLVKVDRNSKVLWSLPDRAHHDISLDEEGRIYALTHDFRKTPPPNLEFLKTPFLEDFIVILSPEGKEIDRIPVLDAIINSDYSGMLQTLKEGSQYAGDFLHTNTVWVTPAALDGAAPFLKKGYITIAMRNLNYVAVIDPARKKVVWAQSIYFAFPHDPEFTRDGTLFIFDNTGGFVKDKRTRALEYDPVSHKIVWEWSGAPEDPLLSEIRGSKEILPNGNILVTESDGGRLLEVTRDKKVVWEYSNPERQMDKGVEKIAVLCGAKRYTRDQLPFLGENGK